MIGIILITAAQLFFIDDYVVSVYETKECRIDCCSYKHGLMSSLWHWTPKCFE